MSNSLRNNGQLIRPDFRFFGFGARMAAIVLCLYWLAIFAGTHLPRLPRSLPPIDDKLAHFGAYFVLTTLMCHTAKSARRIRRFGVIGIVAMTYGAIDELTQTLVPGRTCDVWDYACDVSGIWIAIALYVGAKSAHNTVSQLIRAASSQAG
jgi:VanZ family protein